MDCSGAFKNWHSESCSGCQRCQSVNFCFTLQCVSFRPVPIKSTRNSERIQMDKVAGWGGKRLQGLVSRRYLSVRLIRKTICTKEISKRRSGHFVSKNASGGQSIEEVAQQRLDRYRICLYLQLLPTLDWNNRSSWSQPCEIVFDTDSISLRSILLWFSQ